MVTARQALRGMGALGLSLLLWGRAHGVWWAYNYIPTADTYPAGTLWPHYSLYALSDAFDETRTDIVSLSVGLPDLHLGRWRLSWDAGIDVYRPDELARDEVFGNLKLRFLQEGRSCPAMALGLCYIGGREDLDYWKHLRRTEGGRLRYDRPHRTGPGMYLVASKWLRLPLTSAQVSAGFMWNNFGINEEDVPFAGTYIWLLPERLGLMLDWYGGDYGNWGVGLWWVHRRLEAGFSYFFPVDYPRGARAIESEGLWFMVYVRLDLPRRGRR